MLILQQCYGLSDFELEKHGLIEFLYRKFLGVPEYIPAILQSDHSEKKLLITAKKKKLGTVAKPT